LPLFKQHIDLVSDIVRNLFETLKRPVVNLKGFLEPVAIFGIVGYEVPTFNFVVVIGALFVVKRGQNVELFDSASIRISP
jgi:hypothetical protein